MEGQRPVQYCAIRPYDEAVVRNGAVDPVQLSIDAEGPRVTPIRAGISTKSDLAGCAHGQTVSGHRLGHAANRPE